MSLDSDGFSGSLISVQMLTTIISKREKLIITSIKKKLKALFEKSTILTVEWMVIEPCRCISHVKDIM